MFFSYHSLLFVSSQTLHKSMIHFSFLLVFLSIGSLFSQKITDCPTSAFDPPNDLNQTIWYPSDFSYSDPPFFSDYYSCLYKINVPKGYHAEVRLTFNQQMPPIIPAPVQVIDSQSFEEKLFSATDVPYFFVSNAGFIKLDTRELGIKFGFRIRWYKFPSTFSPILLSTHSSDTQPLIVSSSSIIPYQVSADTNVSLVVSNPKNSQGYEDLLKKQKVSSGKLMTVAALEPFYDTGSMLLFQDFENTKDFNEYQCLICYPEDVCDSVVINCMNTESAALSTITMSSQPAEYLKEIWLGDYGVLDVYMGRLTREKSNLITSYQSYGKINTSSYLPQKFQGTVRTYHLHGHSANLHFTLSPELFTNNVPVGRHGFFSSKFYKSGTPQKNQDSFDYIRTTDTVIFNFEITDADLAWGSTLNIWIRDKSVVTYNKTFTSSSPPNLLAPIMATGNYMEVSYKTNYGQLTNGYFMKFETLDSSGFRNYTNPSCEFNQTFLIQITAQKFPKICSTVCGHFIINENTDLNVEQLTELFKNMRILVGGLRISNTKFENLRFLAGLRRFVGELGLLNLTTIKSPVVNIDSNGKLEKLNLPKLEVVKCLGNICSIIVNLNYPEHPKFCITIQDLNAFTRKRNQVYLNMNSNICIPKNEPKVCTVPTVGCERLIGNLNITKGFDVRKVESLKQNRHQIVKILIYCQYLQSIVYRFKILLCTQKSGFSRGWFLAIIW
ncbi:Protein CBG13817 [Caenorhabditis briggsae]|uniref:Protein CBG13817 n=1 Tax=Caenorhabditis briggsae TaxID=6238 RepID=A8XIR9_CAEBR|nr:Protein CBG13817 [Caenorhabditis briggsae]CAP32544.2 Protein CBG13817 [Caenorhabditis briggsae]